MDACLPRGRCEQVKRAAKGKVFFFFSGGLLSWVHDGAERFHRRYRWAAGITQPALPKEERRTWRSMIDGRQWRKSEKIK